MYRLAFICALFAGAPSQAAAAKPRADQGKKYLDAAVRLFNAFEFERALDQLGKARANSAGAEMDVTIALYEGVLQLELGRDEQGETAFKIALSLDPNATLPARVSPKVQQVFDRLKEEMSKPIPPPPELKPAPPPVVEPVLPPAPPPQAQARRGPSPPGWWWAPAAAGAVFSVSGALLLTAAKGRSDALRGQSTGGDFDLATAERYRSEGKTFQTLGFAALGVGIACIVASAVIFFFMRG